MSDSHDPDERFAPAGVGTSDAHPVDAVSDSGVEGGVDAPNEGAEDESEDDAAPAAWP